MKTQEELNALRNEVETLNKKLAELNEEEMKQVAGGENKRTCPKGRTEIAYCEDCIQCEYKDNQPLGNRVVKYFCLPGYGFYKYQHPFIDVF